jgi:hypothetical protein
MHQNVLRFVVRHHEGERSPPQSPQLGSILQIVFVNSIPRFQSRNLISNLNFQISDQASETSNEAIPRFVFVGRGFSRDVK